LPFNSNSNSSNSSSNNISFIIKISDDFGWWFNFTKVGELLLCCAREVQRIQVFSCSPRHRGRIGLLGAAFVKDGKLNALKAAAAAAAVVLFALLVVVVVVGVGVGGAMVAIAVVAVGISASATRPRCTRATGMVPGRGKV
jgi:hypothetical protein